MLRKPSEIIVNGKSSLEELLYEHRNLLTNADLTNADLRYANLRGANLRGADLGGAILKDSILNEVKYSHETAFLQFNVQKKEAL